MDVLKSLLGSDGINILTDECASVYLDDFDILNVECAKGIVLIWIMAFEKFKIGTIGNF